MARPLDKETARSLRKNGKSYSEIKATLNISKSTLSGWLHDMPLAPEQLRKLRDLNPRRIENFRLTMSRKREKRLAEVYERVRKDIDILSKRDLFISGLYLYWAEGLKSARGTVGLANTDPAMIRMFLIWTIELGLLKEKARIRLHLYKDMNIAKEIAFWAHELGLPKDQFRKPYIKDSKLTGLTYKTGHGHGTCNILFADMSKWEYITMALKRLRELHNRP